MHVRGATWRSRHELQTRTHKLKFTSVQLSHNIYLEITSKDIKRKMQINYIILHRNSITN